MRTGGSDDGGAGAVAGKVEDISGGQDLDGRTAMMQFNGGFEQATHLGEGPERSR